MDKEKIFNKLVEAIEESSLGNMLNMLGGKEALLPLKEPMIKKVNESLNDIYENSMNTDNYFNKEIKSKIERIIQNRLDELTSEDIKKIVQGMIKKHLGWLVVWGAVIGGIFGLIISYIR